MYIVCKYVYVYSGLYVYIYIYRAEILFRQKISFYILNSQFCLRIILQRNNGED